jgi:hypothetical protein
MLNQVLTRVPQMNLSAPSVSSRQFPPAAALWTRLFISTGGHREPSLRKLEGVAQGHIKRVSVKIERCDRITDVGPGRGPRQAPSPQRC